MKDRDRHGRFKSGHKGGRPKGTTKKSEPEKILNDFYAAYRKIGGSKFILTWLKKNNYNQTEFIKILARQIPEQLLDDLEKRMDRMPLRIEMVPAKWPKQAYDKQREELEDAEKRIARLEAVLQAHKIVIPTTEGKAEDKPILEHKPEPPRQLPRPKEDNDDDFYSIVDGEEVD